MHNAEVADWPRHSDIEQSKTPNVGARDGGRLDDDHGVKLQTLHSRGCNQRDGLGDPIAIKKTDIVSVINNACHRDQVTFRHDQPHQEIVVSEPSSFPEALSQEFVWMNAQKARGFGTKTD